IDHLATHERRPGGSPRRHRHVERDVHVLTFHTSSRAAMFTMIVTTNSNNPTSISAATYKSVVASVNSLASTLAMVYDGARIEAEISGRLPITMVTAMVSPSARPSPSTTAPKIPERA